MISFRLLAHAAVVASLFIGIVGKSSAAPTDVVSRSSGLYEAIALLSQKHVIPSESVAATRWQDVTGTLMTRAEFAALIKSIWEEPTDPQSVAALAFARNALAPELGTAPTPITPTTFAATGFVAPEVGVRHNIGGKNDFYSALYGRGTLLGTLGRDGAYNISVTNAYRQTRDHASYTTANLGRAGGDNPDVLNGVDNASVTALGKHGLRGTFGYFKERWGSGYRGDLLVGDAGPPHWTAEIAFPFSLGHLLGNYRFTQFESIYSNRGSRVYHGGRRLEHPIGDRVELSLEEGYNSSRFDHATILVVPYYAYQKIYYTSVFEPQIYNYMANIGLTIRPRGPQDLTRVYGQFVIDDLQAPDSISLGNRVPRKIGYLLGYAGTIASTGTQFVLEYSHADRETYTKVPPSLDWFSGELPMAYPMGPNGKEISLHLSQRVNSRVQVGLEARDRRRASNDFPSPNSRSWDAAVSYRLSPSQALGLRYADYREDPATGTYAAVPGAFGGAAYGELIRRHTVALTLVQGF